MIVKSINNQEILIIKVRYFDIINLILKTSKSKISLFLTSKFRLNETNI